MQAGMGSVKCAFFSSFSFWHGDRQLLDPELLIALAYLSNVHKYDFEWFVSVTEGPAVSSFETSYRLV